MSGLSDWQGLVRQKLFLASRLLDRTHQDIEARDDMTLRQAYLQGALAMTLAARQTALVYIARSHQLGLTRVDHPDVLLEQLSPENPERFQLSELINSPNSWWQKLELLQTQAAKPALEKRHGDQDNLIAVSAVSQVQLSEEILDKILKDMKGWFSELCERYGEW